MRRTVVRSTIGAPACLLGLTLAVAGPAVAQDAPRTAGKPEVLVRPHIEGTLREGQPILVRPGFWSGMEPFGFGNRWERCDSTRCVPTGGVRFLAVLGAADVGKRMRARVTATNAAGSTTVLTDQSGIVKPRLPRYGRLRPFPVVGISGVITGRGVTLRRLAVRGPRGAAVTISCRGRGCPYRGLRGRVRDGVFVARGMRGRSLDAGAVIEVRVTARDRIGKYTRFRIRRRRPPSRLDRCLAPGRPAPSRCAPAS